MPIALGIRPHCGWAVVVAVAVAGASDARLLHRSRIEVLGEGDPAQPWHHAQATALAPEAAEALAARVEAGATAAATRAVADVVAAVGAVQVAAVIGEPQDVPAPAKVLANHTLLHVAEGDLFWSAVAEGCAAAGVPVVAVPPKAIDVAPHAALLTAMGRAAGPPWRADHKLAVVAALAALRDR